MTESLPSDDSAATLKTNIIPRIAWLTLGIGLAAAFATGFATNRWDWAKGILVGSVLAWLNFRWLRRGIEILVSLAAAPGQSVPPKVRVGMVLALLRYGLIGLSVYAIFIYLHLPLASIAAGLCALAAATLVASVWELLNPEDR